MRSEEASAGSTAGAPGRQSDSDGTTPVVAFVAVAVRRSPALR